MNNSAMILKNIKELKEELKGETCEIKRVGLSHQLKMFESFWENKNK